MLYSQKSRGSESELAGKFQEFMNKLYWVIKSVAFSLNIENPNSSAQGNPELYKNRIKLIQSALLPIYVRK